MSSEKHVHVIAFDIPFPPDYGGVIDVFYKLKALHAAGIKIHLHCFEYGRRRQEELNKYCLKVYYYPRQTARTFLFNSLPYIVLTRNSDELKKNLLKDDYPILMEGLHTTFLLSDPELSKRNRIVRTHNVEHDYYENLARVEHNVFKRYYFYNEAGKLKKYESVLRHATAVAAISPADTVYFQSKCPLVKYVPAFHPFEQVNVKPGSGDFLFYHGNLGVGENNEAALFLVNKVFDDLPFKLIIAGSKPSAELKKAIASKQHIQLLSEQVPEQIYEYVKNAQCNVLPTFQSTGIKLKLLASLFSGRFCIVNTPMVADTGLESLCIIADEPEAMKSQIKIIMAAGPLPQSELAKRKNILETQFSNQQNIEKLIELIF